MATGDGSERIEFDVFISHAYEDKDSFVRPLAHALEASACARGTTSSRFGRETAFAAVLITGS